VEEGGGGFVVLGPFVRGCWCGVIGGGRLRGCRFGQEMALGAVFSEIPCAVPANRLGFVFTWFVPGFGTSLCLYLQVLGEMLIIGPSTGVLENAEKTRRAFSHLRPSLLPSDAGIEISTLSGKRIVRGW